MRRNRAPRIAAAALAVFAAAALAFGPVAARAEGDAVPADATEAQVEVQAEGVEDEGSVDTDTSEEAQPTDIYRIHVIYGDPYGGLSDCWVTSPSLFEQTLAETLKENNEYIAPGESVMFGDGKYYTLQIWWSSAGWGIDDVPVLDEYSFLTVSTGTIDGQQVTYHDQEINAEWNPVPETGKWEPWAPGSSSELLPYVRDAATGVITFTDIPELGEWYQLDVKCGEGVSYDGVVATGGYNTSTFSSAYLAGDDPLKDAANLLWSRADGAGSNILLTIPEGSAASYRLEPTNAGSIKVNSVGDGVLGLNVTLNQSATLIVEGEAESVTVTNGQGATLTAPVNSSDPTYYNWMTLKTEHVGGDVARGAVDSVVAVIDNVTGHPYVFDISMIDPMGREAQPLDGDSVTVTLPIPEGLSDEGLHVFHVADDGTVTDMNATVDAEAGTVSFTTTHFSTFVLANVEAGGQAPQTTVDEKVDGLAKTGDAGMMPALMAGASGSAALLGAAVLRKRR